MAYENTTLMYHQLSWSSGFGKFKDIDEANLQARLDQQKLDKLILETTKIPEEKLVEVIKMKQDWYMDTEEALEWGVIDEIMYVPNKKNKRK